jgi:peptide-methionine (R)-S-oxide reductase
MAKKLVMQRRIVLRNLFAWSTAPLLLAACVRDANQVQGAPVKVATASGSGGPGIGRLEKPLTEWQKLLPADAYAVLFEGDTEQPFSSPLNDEHRAGMFICAACALPLFSSTTKFDSGTGWPSFYESLPNCLGTKVDNALLDTRTEYHCIRCGGHQGHVFDDGPKPTGKRYCNNGLALQFVVEGQPLPALRS